MNPFQGKWAVPLLLTLALCLQPVHAEDTPGKCEGLIRRTLATMGQGWRNFRQEVREQGKIRYILAPRPEGSRFNAWAAALDPLIDLPIETYSYVSARYFDRPMKRRLSIFTSLPAGVILWGGLLIALDIKSEAWALQGLEASVNQDISGASYAAEYVLSGAIGATDGAKIVERHHAEGFHGLDNLRMRAEQFQGLNIWRPEMVASLNEILAEIRTQYSPAQLAKRADLEKILSENRKFQVFLRSIPSVSRYTAQLLIEPRVVLFGRSDAYWLSIFFEPFRLPQMTPNQMKGLNSLEEIYKFHSRDLSLATLSHLIAETLGNREGMGRKAKEAAKLGFDRDYGFIYRGNFPLFSQPAEFVDIDQRVPMNSELQRWHLLLRDPRFQTIRLDWQRGEISELTALLRADIQARALSQVYEIAMSSDGKLNEQDACLLIFGKGQELPPNPLFARLRQAAANLQLALAENYFAALVEAAQQKNAATYDSALARAQTRERNLLASRPELRPGSPLLNCSSQ